MSEFTNLDQALCAAAVEANSSLDSVITVDVDTREITIPEGEKLFGVEDDEKVEIKHIRLNKRYIDGNVDLSQFQFRISYENANGDRNYDIVTNVSVSESAIEFDWLLGRSATLYNGTTSFIVCAVTVNGSTGKVTNEWNSAIGKGDVKRGIKATAESIGGKDLVAQLQTLISTATWLSNNAIEASSRAENSANSAAQSAAAADKLATDAAKSAVDADRTAKDIKDSMAQISENKEAVSQLKDDLTEYGDLLKKVDDKSTTMITTIDLDKTNWSNGYINTDGKITSPSDTNWKHTDFINVMLLRGLNITYHLETYSIVNGISFYDKNKTYISGSTSASTRTVEIPSNAYYVRFSCSSTQLTLDNIYVKMPLKKGISDLDLSNNVRLVMIGDSYGIKNTDGDITKFYWEYVKDALGLIENVDFFQKFAEGHGFGSGGYLANLKSLNITDKNKITDIFVCGGWNDCDKSQSYGTDEAFESEILEFNNYVKANFPNATISVAHISWGRFGDNAFYQKMNTSLTRYIYACNKFGWRFISNVEYILRKNDSTLWASDMAHPSNKGQKLLGENLTSPFLSGSADTSYMFNSNTVIIGDKKIMLNSDNSISWSNIN